MTMIISRIEALSQRLERAKEIVDMGLVEDVGKGIHIVLSQRGKEHYSVDEHGCTCPDVQYNWDFTGGWCKHRLAVELFKEAQPKTLSPEELKDTVESLYGPQEVETESRLRRPAKSSKAA